MTEFMVPKLSMENALLINTELCDIVPEDGFCFDFSNMTHFEPFAMLVAGSVIRNYRKRYSEIDFRVRGYEGRSYAGTMGFFKYISPNIDFGKMPGEADGSMNYIPITEIDIDALMKKSSNDGEFELLGDIVERESERLSQIIDRGNVELHKLLTYLFREIIRNTPEHGQTNKLWVCGQYWPSKQFAEIAVLDEGIGIYNSIIKNRYHKEIISCNSDALEWSLKAGISKAISPEKKQNSMDQWANSGYGLYMTSQICRKLSGCFCLASCDNYIQLDSVRKYIGNTQICGTAIMLRVPLGGISSAKELISEISIQGEEEAKTIRNAIKSASKPSKGLMR